MFGFPDSRFFDVNESGNLGDQIRGFGLTNDGVGRHGRPLPERDRVPQQPARAGRRHSGCADAPRPGAVHARVRHRPRADRRPADHADEHERRAWSNPRIDLLIARARAPFASKVLGGAATECDLVAKVAVRRPRTRLFLRSRERHLGPGRRQPEHRGLHAAGDGRNGRPGSDIHCSAARLRPPHRCQQLTPGQRRRTGNPRGRRRGGSRSGNTLAKRAKEIRCSDLHLGVLARAFRFTFARTP